MVSMRTFSRQKKMAVIAALCSAVLVYALVRSGGSPLAASQRILQVKAPQQYLHNLWQDSWGLIAGDRDQRGSSRAQVEQPCKFLPAAVQPRFRLTREQVLGVLGKGGMTLESIVQFYRRWRFDTTLRYVLPSSLKHGLLGRVVELPAFLGDVFQREKLLMKTYDYDPRITSAVYYDAVGAALAADATIDDIVFPFSWYDWADLSILNDFIDLPQSEKPTADWVVNRYFPVDDLFKYESAFGRNLFDTDRARGLVAEYYHSRTKFPPIAPGAAIDADRYCRNSTNPFLPGFECPEVFPQARPEVYHLQARTRLYTRGPIPYSLTFLKLDAPSITVQISNTEALQKDGTPYNIAYSGMLEAYLKRNVKSFPKMPRRDYYFENLPKFENMWDAYFQRANKGPGSETVRKPLFLNLTEADFEFDAFTKLRQLQANQANLTAHQKGYMTALNYSLHSHYADCDKFFTEAGDSTDYQHLGHHFDSRFFRGAISYGEIRARLDALIRAWLSFTNSSNLVTWVAHGSMYAWMYDGLAFPWDGDHDVQMPIRHLHMLAERFNQTVVVDDPTVGNGRYFIDVTSSITSRVHGNGKNNIDARFIDVDSGLYVDITGLSVSSDPVNMRYDWLVEKFWQERNNGTAFYRDPNIIPGYTDLTPKELLEKEKSEKGNGVTELRINHLTDLQNELNSDGNDFAKLSAAERYNLNKHIKVYNCRNKHFTTFEEISPLRLTYFHGMPAYIPNQYLKILRAEYRVPDSFKTMSYHESTFLPEFRLWVLDKQLDRVTNSDSSSTIAEHTIPRDHIEGLTTNEVKLLLQNIAVLPEAEDLFVYLWNTRHITLFRQKEIELQYEKTLSRKKKADLLDTFVRGRRFNGIYKDIFQERMETNFWNNLLSMADVSFPQVLDELRKLHLNLAKELFRINSEMAMKELDWAAEFGEETPGRINFNKYGEHFFSMGERSSNAIFASDPVDRGQSISDLYRTDLEDKFKSKYNDRKTAAEMERKRKEEEERKRKEEEERKRKEEEERKRKEEEEERKKKEEEERKRKEEEEERKRKEEEGRKRKEEEDELNRKEDEEHRQSKHEEHQRQEDVSPVQVQVESIKERD
ncbi:AFR416Cp [Eremothecium gossypii ATCC 10895]|uniref:AFR416Cp n=1 Tax=Eremothecium gossypii (strain ATCC 10895 / CBS 109.51 / FGSC 9923 / NRRL Y-1056) TaxID=284811 RepID=Q753A8_EREGS|nr:AFR416Cp [Eremothecium gossypii ATCC 10895]AAS53787.2 AFR416Cp [Eremothecium gossypii ATCC 10895]